MGMIFPIEQQSQVKSNKKLAIRFSRGRIYAGICVDGGFSCGEIKQSSLQESDMNVIPVIMAGGAGTRLWPMSREDKPKQFLDLSGEGSLLEGTIKRLLPLEPRTMVIATSRKYEDLSRSEIARCGIPGVVLSEPRPRNTAAAVMYAALYIERLAGEAVMVVLPADHYIRKNEEFVDVLKTGISEAEKGSLVTIGIRPTYPETGYGYIKALDKGSGVSRVERFVEKPDIENARKYVASGDYYWNSGIFVWKISSVLEAFRKLMPDFFVKFGPLAGLSAAEIESNSDQVWEIKTKIFDEIESVSIDYGIMEKSENVSVVPGDFGWADLGSWKSIDDILAPDSDGNRSPRPEKTIFVESKNCSVFTEDARISVVGLSDVVVIQAGSDIMVIHKDSSQDVRKVVDIVRKK
jgi:mannose-1-phosphate guanylyltransferase